MGKAADCVEDCGGGGGELNNDEELEAGGGRGDAAWDTEVARLATGAMLGEIDDRGLEITADMAGLAGDDVTAAAGHV